VIVVLAKQRRTTTTTTTTTAAALSRCRTSTVCLTAATLLDLSRDWRRWTPVCLRTARPLAAVVCRLR
jgi:hypothetical protein